jgi:hypothetical protein
MILGIVGSEGAKFTPETEIKARSIIAKLIEKYYADTVVSGACHLGGIDVWAVQEAAGVGCKIVECPPEFKTWQSFKRRNIEIAEQSDRVVCITVSALPSGFKEGGWERYCYHCKTDAHIKSGGCWTVRYAREKLGKPGEIIVV